jgi:hypothetical protein
MADSLRTQIEVGVVSMRFTPVSDTTKDQPITGEQPLSDAGTAVNLLKSCE